MKEIKQVFEHYEKWEDFKAGMYATDFIDKEIKIKNAMLLLSDNKLFHETLKKVISDWPIASSVNLTNPSINKRAWLGAAACMYKFQCPEILTRIAWNLLDKKVQDSANKIAEKIISEYKNNNHAKTLFD